MVNNANQTSIQKNWAKNGSCRSSDWPRPIWAPDSRTTHLVDRLAVLEPLGDVTAQLHRDLFAQALPRRDVIHNGLDVGFSGHLPSSLLSTWDMAVTKVFHSCLSWASSVRPASVRR